MTVVAKVLLSDSRLLYPNLPSPLTPIDLDRLFSPSYADRQWVLTAARTPRSQLAVLVQLLVFRSVGRFLSVEEIPVSVVEYVACRINVEFSGPIRLTNSKYYERTWYRHQDATSGCARCRILPSRSSRSPMPRYCNGRTKRGA